MNNVKINVTRLTDWSLAADCARNTVWKGSLGHEPSDAFKEMLCRSEHSPLRCILYRVDMIGIPSFVSVHFVRHKFGVEHFVSSNRPDRNGNNVNIDRNSPVNHIMVVNAQELIFMARRRLCNKASPETREVMQTIKKRISEIDPVLADFMVANCVYRGGKCPEPDTCQRNLIN